MASSGVNVLRFSALGFGVVYGIRHQSTLLEKAKQNQIERDYQHQLSLVEKAKKELAKKSAEETGVISDPDDSRFDLEAYLNTVAAK
ncbi:hypothetical protein MMC07_003178 [Pseudocyphellaria aurata]|nr:hypothetical protein [Pseudocyphellaria aurata]